MDKTEIFKSIAQNLGDLVTDDTVASSSSTSLDLPSLVHPQSGQLKGNNLFIYSGGGSEAFRVISDFTPLSKRVIVAQAFTTTPSTNAKVAITKQFDKPSYYNAIERAVGLARLYHLEEHTATMQLMGSQYEYSVPSGFEYITSLRLVPSGNSSYDSYDETRQIFELSTSYYRVEPNPLGTMCIIFDSRHIDLDNIDEQWVRVYGQSRIASASTVPDDISEYVIVKATSLLASRKITDGTEWKDKFTTYRDDAKTLEKYLHVPRRGIRVG